MKTLSDQDLDKQGPETEDVQFEVDLLTMVTVKNATLQGAIKNGARLAMNY